MTAVCGVVKGLVSQCKIQLFDPIYQSINLCSKEYLTYPEAAVEKATKPVCLTLKCTDR